ncbi:hypothetical protein EIP91_011834 [Steccherinum ochraceum]|uniref:Uncharacterized protein n=1 Tax=Steccherinum ochraceum TaxID=92696 RepID=A0A4R0RHD4_9APHY|nr:hypothetical protein EIP91_011834 [Steccherinum ochraceum]
MVDSPQVAPVDHPSLYLSIIRQTTVFTMPYNSSDSKDQLRSLKSAMQSRIGSTFRPRRNTLVGRVASTTPSPTDSECSTLIDFNLDEAEVKPISGVIYEDDTDRAIMLEEDNCAWVDERAYNASLNPTRPVRARTSQGQQVFSGPSDMIDEEDRAWCMPSKQAKPKSSTLFSFSPRRQKAVARGGLEPEMLDEEDRAWM